MTPNLGIQPPGSGAWTTQDWAAWLDGTGAVCSVRATDYPLCQRCRRPARLRNDGEPWRLCFECDNVYRRDALVRAVVPISWSVSGGLTGAIARAKAHPVTEPWIRTGLASLLYTFIRDHRSCIERNAFGSIDFMTVVPSHPSRRNGWDHMKELIGCVQGGRWAGLEWDLDALEKVIPSAAETHRRRIDPDLFRVGGHRNFAGRRILLIDDLYTSGSTTAAAVHALRAAGADPPTVLDPLGVILMGTTEQQGTWPARCSWGNAAGSLRLACCTGADGVKPSAVVRAPGCARGSGRGVRTLF